MPIIEFIKRSVVVTLCIGSLLYFFYPRYEFIESKIRCNRVTGDVDRYYQDSNGSWDWH